MRQYFYVKETSGYSVRVTSESGCNSDVVQLANTKRTAKVIIARLNKIAALKEMK